MSEMLSTFWTVFCVHQYLVSFKYCVEWRGGAGIFPEQVNTELNYFLV